MPGCTTGRREVAELLGKGIATPRPSDLLPQVLQQSVDVEDC